jgi:hypothetical protein
MTGCPRTGAEKLGPKREEVRGGLENRKTCSPPQTLLG